MPKRLNQTPTSGSNIPLAIGRLQTHKTWPGNHGEIPAKRTHHPSSSESDLQPSPEQRTPLRNTPTSSLKRDSSYASYSSMRRPQSAILDSDDLTSSVDGRQDDEDSDYSDYHSAVSRRRRMSREPSETPSIASATGTLSISVNAKAHDRHTHHYLHQYQQRPGQYPQHKRYLSAIYPQKASSRAGSATGSDIHPTSALTSGSQNDPFLNSRGPSPLPPPFPDTYPEQRHVRSPSQSSAIENQKLNELQQELAAIKEQLRSLVSARQDDLQRSQLSPVNFGSVPPPPPPPPFQVSTSLVAPKKWTPPQTEASQSMQNVLKELSSQKVRLRKTGSPFVSRISSAVDGSTSSPYTSVTFKPRSGSEASPQATARSDSPAALTKRQRGSSKGG
ncbi:hypothetical protein BGZ58_005763 [Dissophora ornata]|nr:hypothetical protein BGZ58_005763 [Dissophora ornata]